MDKLVLLENILFKENIVRKEDLFETISQMLYESGTINDSELFIKDLNNREEQMQTGLIDEFAIPHAQSSSVTKATIAFVKTGEIENYETLDDSKVKYVFILAIPKSNNDLHLDMLSSLSRRLMDDTYRSSIKACKNEQMLYELLREDK